MDFKKNAPSNQLEVSAALRRLSRSCPALKLGFIGRSVLGRAIFSASVGHGERRLLLSAGHHANEWVGTQVLMRFLSELCSGGICRIPSATIFDKCTIYMVPLLNPDGVDLASGRLRCGDAFSSARLIAGDFPEIPFPRGWKANIKGIDLNLQYPAGWEEARRIKHAQGFDSPAPRDYVGTTPLQAPEALALAAYTRSVSPDAVVALHSQGQVIYWKYGELEPCGSAALGQRMSAVSGYALETTPYESGHAGYKDWFIKEFSRPGYTVELGLGENPLPGEQFCDIYAEASPMLLQAALWNT